MLKCKHARSKTVQGHIKSRIMISLLALVLVCCVTISGTLAWMMRQTAPVVNTFTVGDIQIELAEQAGIADIQDENLRQFTMVPGQMVQKDPVITVKAGSESCWLFAELDESENFDQFLSYEPAEGWEQLNTTGSAVYYRMVLQEDTAQTDQTYPVLLDNQVTVKNVPKAELEAMESYPTLTVTAYAIQRDGIVDSSITDEKEQAEMAWALIAEQHMLYGDNV